MEIIKKKIKDLIGSKYNPRKISEEQLEKLEESMDKFGYVEPMIWNKQTDNLVGGHQRLKILRKKLKAEDEVEVVVVDLDKYQEKVLNIALNKIAGEWDEDLLGDLLTDIKNNSDMIEFTGFNEEELDMYFKIANSSNEETEDRDKVITVEPPNAPVLKERVSIHIDDEKDYFYIKDILSKRTKEEILTKLRELQ